MASWPRTRARRRALAAAPAAAKAHSSAAARRRRAFGGVAWIVVFGVLLAGVVAINVAVLQLNLQLDKLGSERVQLRADKARLRSQLSSAGAAAQIESQAKSRLGLVQADPTTTSYVELPPR